MKTLILFILLNSTVSFALDLPTLNCLYEGRGETLEGMIEIHRVVLKRVQDKRWPNSLDKVIMQPHQFSWTLDIKEVNFTEKEIRNCKYAVKEATKLGPSEYGFYYAGFGKNAINVPYWAKNPKKIKIINNHIFIALQ